MRSNQSSKLIFVDLTIDGTGNNGKLTVDSIYVQRVTATKIGFYRASDNTLLMSLDTSGNLRCLGTITQSVAP